MNTLFSVTDFQNTGLVIEQSAYVSLDSRWQCKDGCSAFSRIYCITKGGGYLRAAGKEFSLTPGFLYIIPAGTHFSYGCESMEKIYFHVRFCSTGNYDLLCGVNGVYTARLTKAQQKALMEDFTSSNYICHLKLKQFLCSYVLDFCKNAVPENAYAKSYSPVVEKAINYIDSRSAINLTTKDIASRLYISESKLRLLFREETGVSIGHYIDNAVMTRAKQMLFDKSFSIGEISAILGFCDQFYFARRFRAMFGLTPSSFRRKQNI